MDLFHCEFANLFGKEVFLNNLVFDVFSLIVGDAEVRLDDSDVEVLDFGSSLGGDVEELLEVGAKSFVDLFI